MQFIEQVYLHTTQQIDIFHSKAETRFPYITPQFTTNHIYQRN